MPPNIKIMKKELERRLRAMQKPRDARWPHWQAIGELVQPRTGRFDHDVLRTDRESDMNDKIINSTGTLAHRIYKSGMHTGLTSHTSPWFARRFENPDLNEWGPAREWLERQVMRQRQSFDRSTFYNLCPRYYGDTGLFGVAAMHMDAHPVRGHMVNRWPIGTYSIARARSGKVDSIYVEIPRTVRDLVDEFGKDRVSRRTRNMYDNGDTERQVKTIHAIEPNDDRIPGFLDFRGMPFRSVKWEVGSNDEEILELSGYREFPAFVTVWDRDLDDLWGSGLGADALPDLRMAQKLELDLLEQLDKVGDPAVNAPMSMQADGVNLNPGTTNWVADPNSSGVAPVHQIDPKVLEIEAKILKTENRIMQHFFANLFEAINQSATPGNRRDRTAFEVDVLEKEKLVQLIPALENFFTDFLEPAVERDWRILDRQDLLEEPPPGVKGEVLKTEFTSTLALARRIVQNAVMTDGINFALGISEAFPQALDRINADGMLTTYLDNIGMPAKAVHSDDEFAQRQADRQQAEAAAAQLEAAESASGTAKTLAETQPEETNALGMAMGAGG